MQRTAVIGAIMLVVFVGIEAFAGNDFSGRWLLTDNGKDFAVELTQIGTNISGTFVMMDTAGEHDVRSSITGIVKDDIAHLDVKDGGRASLSGDGNGATIVWTPIEASGKVLLPTAEIVAQKDFATLGERLIEEETLAVLEKASHDADVVRLLGKPEGKSKAAVSEADGMEHRQWIYKKRGIMIDFVTGEDKALIVNALTLTNLWIGKTSRSIGIGSTADDVRRAYAHEIDGETDDSPEKIVAGTEFGGIVFGLEKGVVRSIFIGAAAE